MHIEAFRDYCLAKSAVTESFPFGEQTLVFKVAGKMFALVDVENFESVNLKCPPEQAIEWREQYMAVQPGYHMNKQHWNTVSVNEDVDDAFFLEMVDLSYNLVVQSLSKKVRAEFSL